MSSEMPKVTEGKIPFTVDLASKSPPEAVIFYDQIGTGLSTHLQSKDTSFWTIELFINELETVLSFFDISSCFNPELHYDCGCYAQRVTKT
ncbi:hypothetical protein OF83DRAFT_1173242 [Amylostereum chailletii]|nr:hypothetical protein OF83DRAFT_1173242 [Amylostereum chailletii]